MDNNIFMLQFISEIDKYFSPVVISSIPLIGIINGFDGSLNDILIIIRKNVITANIFSSISSDSFTYYEYKDKENKNSIKFWVSSSESRMCSKVDNDTYRTNIDCDITIKDINNVKNYKLKNINFSVLNIIDNFNSYYNASYYLDNLYQENPLLSNYNNATYYGITGDYNGIVSSFDYSGYKNVKLFNNGKTYQFGFDGHGYFTDNYINDFISTVVFLQTKWSFLIS